MWNLMKQWLKVGVRNSVYIKMVGVTGRGKLGCFRIIFGIIVCYLLFLTFEVNLKFDLTGYTSPYIMSRTLGKFSSISGIASLRWLFKDTQTNSESVSISGPKSQIPFNRTLVVSGSMYRPSIKIKQATRTVENKTIIWYNPPAWFGINNNMWKQCLYENCFMTKSQKELRNASAVLFSPHEELPWETPVPKQERNPDQAWVLFSMEAPLSFSFGYRHDNWKHTMNWTMTYTTHADFFSPYGLLKPRTSPLVKDYGQIFKIKTKEAAWIVSHCGALSRRDEYVKEMQAAGFKVDIFGKCSQHGQRDRRNPRNLVQKDYKFYLSFENAFCVDYITEKFFDYIDMDVVLVVRGGANYSRLLPKGTFIDASEFPSAKELVKYLHEVSASESLYTYYLRTKHKYIVETGANQKAYCELCERLNNIDDYRSEISDHVLWLHSNTCWEPRDIQGYYLYHVTEMALPMCFIIGVFVTCFICVCITRKKYTS